MGEVIAFPTARNAPTHESLADFARTWLAHSGIAWRESTRARVESILRAHVLPELANYGLMDYDRASLLAFRARLAQSSGAGAMHCSPSRINAIVQVMGQCLAERERQLGVRSPCRDVPRLRARRPTIRPFTLPELRWLVAVAPDYLQDYVWVRGILGLRSGEANGLRWDCVDLTKGTLEIAHSRTNGVDGLPKNEHSERVIALVPSAAEALRRQWARTGTPCGYVFLSRRGHPLDIQNFARREWRILLEKAGLPHRPPEQLRHTAATLMLAAGEAPTYVAQVLGHADCRMLLTVYARFMPGALGRNDGVALDAALHLDAFSLVSQRSQ